MSWRGFRRMVSYVLLVLFPAALFAADSNAAMLYTNGPTWVNGAHVPRSSSAIFSGDLLQTRYDSVANINQPGSTITVRPDSLVQFEGLSIKIEHGGVAVSTSKELATTAGDVRVTPASNLWTEFDVVDTDGNVHIAARKGDLLIADGKESFTLQQGQETTRPETAPSDNDQNTSDNKGKKKNRKVYAGAAPAATGGTLNSPIAVGIGGAVILGVGTWVLVKYNDDPASPSVP
jgi:hypothetical protein